MKKITKKHLKSLGLDISNRWIISLALGIISAFFTGLYATISPHVPVDLKQTDVIFILSIHILVLVSGCIMVLYGSSWRMRFLPLLLPLIASISLYFYYQKVVIYDINSIPGPKIIIFYPDEFKDAHLKSEWEKSLREIPKTISLEGIKVKLIKWPNKFSGEIDKTVIGKLVNNRTDVVGSIAMSENSNSVLLQLTLPSINSYRELGISWITTETSQTLVEKTVTVSTGFDSFTYNAGIKLEADGPHLGSFGGVFTAGAAKSDSPIGLDEISDLRILPVADILEVPKGNLSRGTYFASNMIAIAYLKLAGYQKSFCESLERFTKFDIKNPDFDLLKELNPSAAATCLYKNGPDIIQRIISELNEEDRNEIVKGVSLFLLGSDKYDELYKDTTLFPKGTYQKLLEIRQYCELLNSDLNNIMKSQCLLEVLRKNEDIKISNPFLWSTLASKFEDIEFLLMPQIFSQINLPKMEHYMIEWHKISKFLGGDRDHCDLPWDNYLIYFFLTQGMQVIGNNPDNIVKLTKLISTHMLNVSNATQCKEILIFGFDISDFLRDEELRLSTETKLNELIELSEYGKIKDIITKTFSIIEPFTDNDSAIKPYLNSEISIDNLYALFDFFFAAAAEATDYQTSEIFENIIDNIDTDEVLDSTIEELFEMYDDDYSIDDLIEPYLLSFINLKDKLKDPVSNEAIRLIEKLALEQDDFDSDILQPDVIKNPIHMISLYFYLKQHLDRPKEVGRLLKSVSRSYPDEKDTLIYKHFKMHQAHYAGKTDKATEIAKEIMNAIDIPQQSFYPFYISYLNEESNNINCKSENTKIPGWINHLLSSNKDIIIDHLLQNKTHSNTWNEITYTYPAHQIYVSHESNANRFKRSLSHYIIEYQKLEKDNINQADNMEIDFDKALLKAIKTSQLACKAI